MKKPKPTRQPKQRSVPRTNLRWQTHEEYEAARRAAGNIPLATYVRDVFLRALQDGKAA